MTEPQAEEAPQRWTRLGIGALVVWLALAALGQLVFVGYWPMYLHGVMIPRWPALAIAFLRIGIYVALACGLVAGERTAWAATVLELARSFLLAALTILRDEWIVIGAVYPAGWTQGLLGGALPVLLGINVALSAGWRPSRVFDVRVFDAARVLMGAIGLTGLWLRGEREAFGVREEDESAVFLRQGLPLIALLTVAEALAAWIAWRGGRGAEAALLDLLR